MKLYFQNGISLLTIMKLFMWVVIFVSIFGKYNDLVFCLLNQYSLQCVICNYFWLSILEIILHVASAAERVASVLEQDVWLQCGSRTCSFSTAAGPN